MTPLQPSHSTPSAPAEPHLRVAASRDALAAELIAGRPARGGAFASRVAGAAMLIVELAAIMASALLLPVGSVPLAWRLALAVVMTLTLVRRGAHRPSSARQRPSAMAMVVAGAGLQSTVLLLAASSLVEPGPVAQELLWLGLAMTAVAVVARALLQVATRSARRRGFGTVPTLIVGAGIVGRQLERRMQQHPELGFAPIGFLDDDPSPLGQLDAGSPAPMLGPTDKLEDVLRRTGATHVVFAFTRAPDSEVLPLLRQCQRAGVDVSVMPRLFENVNGRVRVEQLAGLPLLALRQTDPKSWQFAVKHASDRIIAAVMLVLLAPLLALLAVAVRLSSPGPVLYRQERVGRDGRPFKLLKFRSMRVGGSASIDARVLSRLELEGLGPGGIEGVDRRTPIGKFLRRSGLDELPQLLNVLRGEMSIVGPRPERPDLANRFGERVRRYDDRHLVRSGITGWAQVHGLRGQTSIAERIEWDNWYIQNWSLALDAITIALTPLAILRTPSEAVVSEEDDAPAASQ